MTPQENAALIRSLYDSFNLKNYGRAKELSAQGALIEVLPFGMRVSPDEVFQNWAQAFPDGKAQIRSLVASEDRVVCEFTGRGTQTGPMRGPEGVLPPTGRRVELDFCDIYELKDGKIVSGRSYFDGAALIRQLGIGTQVAAQEEARQPVGVH